MSRNGKYIIEITEKHTHYTDDGKPYNLYRVKGFNTLTFDDYGLDKLEKYDDMKDYTEAIDVLADRELTELEKTAIKDLKELIRKYNKCKKRKGQ